MLRILKRIGYCVVYYLWVCLPAGMGAAPWHRLHKIFKLEK